MLSLQLTNPVIPQFPPSNFCSQDHRYSSTNASCSLSLSNPFSRLSKRRTRNIYALHDSSNSGTSRNDGVEDYQVLTALRSIYNDIVIVDTPESRMLLLDSTRKSFTLISMVYYRYCLKLTVPFMMMQIMFIAFLTSTRNGLNHIGYVHIHLNFSFPFLLRFVLILLFFWLSLLCLPLVGNCWFNYC